MTQLAQRLGLDLPDALPRDREVLPDLFQRVVGVLADPEALAQHALLARREGLQRVVDLALQIVADGCVQRRDGLLVLDEVPQMAVFLLADGRLQRDRLLGDLEDLANLVQRKVHLLGDLFGRRLTPQLLDQVPRGADQLVDGLDHVHRDPDGPGLIGDGAGDGLADPPRRVGAELVAPLVLELVHGLHQTDVPLLDQVQELQPAVGVLLGDADHEPQVGLDQLGLAALDLFLGLVQKFDALAELFGGNQGLGLDAPDAAPRVVGGILNLVEDVHGHAGLAADRDEHPPPAAELGEQGVAFLARYAEPAPAVRQLALAGCDILREVPHPLDQALALDRMEVQAVQLLRGLAAGLIELGLDLFSLRRAEIRLAVPGIERQQSLGQHLRLAYALQRTLAELADRKSVV